MGQLCSCHSGKASRSSKGFAKPWASLLQKKKQTPSLPSVGQGQGQGQGQGKGAGGGEFRGCYDNLHFQNPSNSAIVDSEAKENASPTGQPCGGQDDHEDAGRKDGSIAIPAVPTSADPPTLRKRALYRANRWAGAQSLNLPGDLDICGTDAAENPGPGWLRKKPRRAQSVSEAGDRWGRDRLVDNTKEWLCDRLDPWVLFQRLQETQRLNAGLAVELGRCTTRTESCRCMLDFVVSPAGDSCCDFRVVRELLSPYQDEGCEQTMDFLELIDAVLYLNDLIRTLTTAEDRTCISSSSEQALPDSSGLEPGSPLSKSTRALTVNASTDRQTDGGGGYFRAEMVDSVCTRPCLYELGIGSVDRGQVARDNSFARRRHSDLCHPDDSSNYHPRRKIPGGKQGHEDDPISISIAVYNVDLTQDIVRGLRKILVDYSHVKRVSIVRTRISKDAFSELFQVFHRPLPPGLTHFDFRMNHLVDDEEGESTGSHLSGLYAGLRCAAASLTSLNLSSTGMTGEGCRRLVDAIGCGNRVLSELDLGYNELGDAGCEAIAEFIEIPGCWLRRLRLRHNAVGPDGARRLARALTCQPTLTLVDFSSNPIGDDGSTAVLESLLSNRSLRDLAVDDCGLTPDACPALARALRTNSVLRTLTLSRNPIGDRGVRTAAEGLRYNRTVEVIGVDMCGMGNDGFARLLRELHWCHSLRVVKACYNRIGLPAETIAVGVSRRWSSALPPETPALRPRDPPIRPRDPPCLATRDVYAQLCEVLRVNPKLRIFLWGNRVDDGRGEGASAPSPEERGRVVPNCRRSLTVDDPGYGTLSREQVNTRL